MLGFFKKKKKQYQEYDRVPDEYYSDPLRIWKAQISGEKNFDSCSFMGALNGLRGHPNWRYAFDGTDRYEGFMDRLDKFFGLCQSLGQDDDRQFLYFHPSRTRGNPGGKKQMTKFVENHLELVANFAEERGARDFAKLLRETNVVWFELTSKTANKNAFESKLAMGYWDYFCDMHISNKASNLPHFYYCVSEAAYSLANNYPLQHYLLQDFSSEKLDIDEHFEFLWINKGKFWFDENECFVSHIEFNGPAA